MMNMEEVERWKKEKEKEEINEKVARKLGWYRYSGAYVWNAPDGTTHGDEFESGVPDYCHSIEAAWEICISGHYYVELKRADQRRWRCLLGDMTEPVYADTAPMAIALAFLKLP